MFPGLVEGRIVHFVLANGAHRPAIVVNAWAGLQRPDGYANLVVFKDGENDGPGAPILMWMTSKVYSADHEPGTWHWPEPTPR